MNGSFGRVLLLAGLTLALVGLALIVAERLPWLRLGRLPGDLKFGRANFTIYLPLASSLLVSALLTLIWWLVSRWRS